MEKASSDCANIGWTVDGKKKVISKKKKFRKTHPSYFCKVTQEAMTSLQKDAGKKKSQTNNNNDSASPVV